MCKTHKTRLQKQKSLDKAEQILKGALPEFLHHGYVSTSMERIAIAARVSKQTLYSHFSDKDGLFSALVKYIACKKFRDVWLPLEGDPEKVLRALGNGILSEVNDQDYIAFMRMMVAESGKKPELAQLFLNHLAVPAMKMLIKYFQGHPELEINDPEATARIFVGSLVHFMITQEMLHGKELMPMDGERLLDNLIQLIVKNKPQ